MSESDDQEFFDLRMAKAMAAVHESFWAEKTTVRFWFRMMIAMVVCQFGALGYDFTLPSHQSLSVPFLLCFFLALLGGQFPMRRQRKHLDKMAEVAQEFRDEHYRLITGEARL